MADKYSWIENKNPEEIQFHLWTFLQTLSNCPLICVCPGLRRINWNPEIYAPLPSVFKQFYPCRVEHFFYLPFFLNEKNIPSKEKDFSKWRPVATWTWNLAPKLDRQEIQSPVETGIAWSKFLNSTFSPILLNNPTS